MAEDKSILEKTLDTINDGLSKRMSDPIISTYSVSFLIWNFKIFIWIFSGHSPDTIITKIEEILSTKSAWGVPLIATSLILLMPHIFHKLYTFIEEGKVLSKNARTNAEKKLLSINVLIKGYEKRIQDEIGRTKDALDQVQQKSEDNGRFQKTIEDLEKENTELKNIVDKSNVFETDAEPAEMEAISYLSRNALIGSFEKLAAEITVGSAYVKNFDKVILTKLQSNGLISTGNTNAGIKGVFLTALGKAAHQRLLTK